MKSVAWQCMNCPILPDFLSVQASRGLSKPWISNLEMRVSGRAGSLPSSCVPVRTRRAQKHLNGSLKQLVWRSLSGHVASSAALLCDTILANLKTSARVTSLFILLLENVY